MRIDVADKAEAGVIVFQLISGDLPRKGRVELYVDDATYPAFISTKSRSVHQKWDEIGEGFVREMEFSRLVLCINTSSDDVTYGEDNVAEFTCDTRELLEACLVSLLVRKGGGGEMGGGDGRAMSGYSAGRGLRQQGQSVGHLDQTPEGSAPAPVNVVKMAHYSGTEGR